MCCIACTAVYIIQDFYVTKRLEPQVDLIEVLVHSDMLQPLHQFRTLFLPFKRGGDREARILLEKLKPKVSAMFEGIEVEPSLLHGDLWSGNFSETVDAPGL